MKPLVRLVAYMSRMVWFTYLIATYTSFVQVGASEESSG